MHNVELGGCGFNLPTCRGRKRKADTEAPKATEPQSESEYTVGNGSPIMAEQEKEVAGADDDEYDDEDEELPEDIDPDVEDYKPDPAEDQYFLYAGDPTQRDMPVGEPQQLTQEEYEEMCDLPMVSPSPVPCLFDSGRPIAFQCLLLSPRHC